MLGISKLNLFNDSEVIEGISFADLGLSCQTEIQYKKECVFDITSLVPMILLLGPDPGSEHVFDVKVTDLAGQVTEQSLTFTAPALVRVDQTDLWKNTASLSDHQPVRRRRRVALEYRIKGESAWNAASVSGPNDDGSRTALISPDWTTGTNEAGLTIHSVDPKTGIFARKSYEYQLLADGANGRFGRIHAQKQPRRHHSQCRHGELEHEIDEKDHRFDQRTLSECRQIRRRNRDRQILGQRQQRLYDQFGNRQIMHSGNISRHGR